MRIFKGNRFITPRFNYPVFKFERSRKIVVGRNKLSVPWYRPYSYAFTLFEHEMRARQNGLYKIVFRGFWHNGVPTPMAAEVSRYNVSYDKFEEPVLYILDWELPSFFNKDYVFLNPYGLTEENPKVFQFEPKFDAWFKEQLWDWKLMRSAEETAHEEMLIEASKELIRVPVEKELMGVSLHEDERYKWFGKISIPLWALPEDIPSLTNELKAELKRQVAACA